MRASAIREASSTMRAARIVAPRRVVVERVETPDPAADEVRFRVEGCGVCASNIGPWHGLPWIEYPLAPGSGGHEAWGIVDAVGSRVKGIACGDRVAAISYNAYAEYDVANAASVVPLPEDLHGRFFPGEAFGCARNIFRRANIRAGQNVAIIGIGFLGALLTRFASGAGARVFSLSRRPFALDVARRMGAAETLAAHDRGSVVEQVSALTGGRLCDTVIEAVGTQEPLDLAGELVKTRGTIVLAGYHQDGPRSVNLQLWNWKGLDVINAHERDPAIYVQGIRDALAFFRHDGVGLTNLCTHQYPLEALGEALDATWSKPEGFLKSVVVP